MKIGDSISSLLPAPDLAVAGAAPPADAPPSRRLPAAPGLLRRPAPANAEATAALPPRGKLPPGDRQPVTAAKISAAVAALAAARGLRSIVSVGRDVGLDRGVANKHIAPDGQCRHLGALMAYPDYPLHAQAIDASLRALGHASQADALAALAQTGKRPRATPRRTAAARPGHMDAHKLVQALQYFQQRAAVRVSRKPDDDTLLRSVDEVVGLKARMVSGWVTTTGALAKPLESIARLPGYLERREEIRGLLVAFGHEETAASLLDYVPTRQHQPSAASLARALAAMAGSRRGALRAAELASGLSRSTLNSHLKGDDAVLARKISSLPDYDTHAESIRAALQRIDRKALAEALPPTTLQRSAQCKAKSPVPWPAQVFLERAGGNLHKIEATARLIRAGMPLLEATRKAKAHKALILPLLDDQGALRDAAHVVDMLDGMTLPVERRIRELMARLARRLDPEPAPPERAVAARARAKLMPAHEFMDRASLSLTPIRTAARLLREAPAASRGAVARSVGASPSIVRALFDPQGVLRHERVVERALDGFDQRASERLPGLIGRLADSLGQTPTPPQDEPTPMRSLTMKSGVFGTPRQLVVDRRTRMPKHHKMKGIYEQNPGLVQPPRSFADDRHRQPLRWLSTVLKEAFDNSLEVQCYFDAARRQIILSTNRTFLNKQIADFVRSGKLTAMLAAQPPRLAPPQADRVERHFAKLAGRMDPAADPHLGEASDAVLAAIAEGRIEVADHGFRDDGKRIAPHAERRILHHVETRLGEPLVLSNLAGTMRMCGDCAEALDAGAQVRRGPFFTSQAARMATQSDDTRARNERDGIGTFVTRTRDEPARLTFAHDTDSDSDARFSDASDTETHDVRAWLKAATGAYKRTRTWTPSSDDEVKRARFDAADTKPSKVPDADFDWGRHLRNIGGGEPPAGMVAPHAHHIVFQNGRGARMNRYLDESKAILARHRIDPTWGRENLVWAPNQNHSTAAARAVRDALVDANKAGSRDAVAAALARLGRHFAERTIATLYQ